MLSLQAPRSLLRNSTCLARRWIPRTAKTYATEATSNNLVNIVEVGPRDGLQNEKGVIPVDTKVELINRLARAGAQNIEAGSFVSPKWVPQVSNNHGNEPWHRS